MPEKERAPYQPRQEKGGVSQSQRHLHDKSAEELLTELERKMDTMTDQSYDEDVVDAYLEALDEKDSLPEQFDVETSWNRFRSQHAILFIPDDSQSKVDCSKSISHKFHFRRAILRVVSIAATIGIFGMFCAQAAGINVIDMIARWTAETFTFTTQATPASSTGEVNDELSRIDQYQTLQDAFDIYSISERLAPTWLPDEYTRDYVEVTPLVGEIVFSASYSNNQSTLSLEYSYWTDGTFVPAVFEKDQEDVLEYEKNGITHYIMSNENVLVAVWVNGTCECSISGTLKENEMKAIIDSIYV